MRPVAESTREIEVDDDRGGEEDFSGEELVVDIDGDVEVTSRGGGGL